MQTRPFDVERSKYMNLMNCHAACIYLPREILISCESLSLRELTVHVLLDLELYRIVKNDAVSELPSVRRLKVSIVLSAKCGSNFPNIT